MTIELTTLLPVFVTAGGALAAAIAALWRSNIKNQAKVLELLEGRDQTWITIAEQQKNLYEERLQDVKDFETKYTELLLDQEKAISNLSNAVQTLVNQLEKD